MRSRNRTRWTGCNAAVAFPAAIWDQLIRRQFKRSENFGEKKPGPEALIDEHGALAVPANASLRGIIPFQHRSGVDVTFLLPTKAAKKLVDSIQLCSDEIVIVLAPRVSRDPACWSCSRGAVGRLSLKITYRKSNYRPRTRQNLLWVASLFLATLHVIHFTVRAVTQPFTKFICVRWCGAGGYATRIKSNLFRKRNKPHLQNFLLR